MSYPNSQPDNYTGKSSNLLPYISISLSALVVLSFSYSIGFFGDDYSWMLQAKLYDGNLLGHLFSPAPYGYFRPVVKLFFLVWYGIFTDNVISYRVFILILHILCCLMLYHLLQRADYSRNVAWVSAIIFAVITCHSEALYSINSISEIFSALFIITGLYFLLSDKKYFAILFFMLALFSRESALCFIPLALVFLYKKNVKIVSLQNAVVLITPIIIYFLAYLISHNIFEFVRYGPPEVFTLNIFSMGYKVIHYFVNMILPAKMILFVLTAIQVASEMLFGWPSSDIRLQELVINAVKDPSNNLLIVISIALIGILFFAAVFLWIRKSLKGKDIVFPIAVSLAALIIYIPMIPTAERFLYLPSIGICLLLGIIWNSLEKKRKDNGFVFLVLIIFLYVGAMGERAFYLKSSTVSRINTLENLHNIIKDDQNDNVLILNYDRKYYINEYTLPDMYMYFYGKRKTFRFDELQSGEDPEKFIKVEYTFNSFLRKPPE